MIRVAVAGATGRVGREVCRGVIAEADLKLVGATALDLPDSEFAKAHGFDSDVVSSSELSECLRKSNAQVMVDFTHPDAVMENLRIALDTGVHCVVGTTGIGEAELAEVEKLAGASKANVLIAPNFALGAVLMMKCSELISQYFGRAEIIEMHHDKKADAPSGTALKTAAGMARARKEQAVGPAAESVPGVRGGGVDGYRIHSVRLPGLMAHQEVIFGAPGQVVTVRHDALDRSCYVPGVLLGVRKIGSRPGLTFGLENMLDI